MFTDPGGLVCLELSVVTPNGVTQLARVDLNVEVRIVVVRSVAVLNAAVDLTLVVGPNAVVRIEVIPSVVTQIGVTQDATGDFPNAGVRAVVLIVVQDVVPDVVIQSAATRYEAARCVQVAVFQYVADLDAMVVLQHAAAKVLPDGARGDVLDGRLAPDAAHVVQSVAEVEAAQVA
jgi:hypothetical protein